MVEELLKIKVEIDSYVDRQTPFDDVAEDSGTCEKDY